MKNKTILVISCSSDIGNYISKKYSTNNQLIGTFRTPSNEVTNLEKNGVKIFNLDIQSPKSIVQFSESIESWDICYFCIGEPLPIGKFFDINFKDWKNSVDTNSISQLELLHHVIKKANDNASVIFFGSGGVNKAVEDFSAYTIGKTILCKSVELIAEENPQYKFIVFGPGWLYSKMHSRIYGHLDNDTEWKNKTGEMIKEGINESEYENVVQKIEKLIYCPNNFVSGKNFCVSDDLDNLSDNKETYKFRRKE